MMKHFITLIIFTVSILNFGIVQAEELPELPNLPDFDVVMPPAGIDAFAPADTPSEVVSSPAVQHTSTQTSIKQTAVSQNSQTNNTTSISTNKPAKQTNVSVNNKNVTTTNTKPKQNNVVTTSAKTNNNYYKNNTKALSVIPKGKKFKVVLKQSVSSSTPVGTKVTFQNLYPETSKYITIPAGTTFQGKIVDSHQPQITGNGGLIVIEIKQMIYKGVAYPINAKVSVADDKHIFFNNIKGKRMYLRSFPKAIKPGSTFFKKMWNVTKRLAKNESGVEIILTPFSFVTGTVVYAVNFVATPVLAIFYKGKSITIPANSQFIIQLREDATVIK